MSQGRPLPPSFVALQPAPKRAEDLPEPFMVLGFRVSGSELRFLPQARSPKVQSLKPEDPKRSLTGELLVRVIRTLPAGI